MVDGWKEVGNLINALGAMRGAIGQFNSVPTPNGRQWIVLIDRLSAEYDRAEAAWTAIQGSGLSAARIGDLVAYRISPTPANFTASLLGVRTAWRAVASSYVADVWAGWQGQAWAINATTRRHDVVTVAKPAAFTTALAALDTALADLV